jgi:ribosomal-protein-alanine N-acetyltransferase
MFVAEREGKLLGYLLLYCAADEAEIVRIAVKEEVRRQGISQVMMDAMLDWCRTNRISKLMLDVRCSNEQAIALYRKNGFVEDGTRKNFYKQPDEDALLMSRTI